MTPKELRDTIHRPATSVLVVTPKGEVKSLQDIQDEKAKKTKEKK